MADHLTINDAPGAAPAGAPTTTAAAPADPRKHGLEIIKARARQQGLGNISDAQASAVLAKIEAQQAKRSAAQAYSAKQGSEQLSSAKSDPRARAAAVAGTPSVSQVLGPTDADLSSVASRADAAVVLPGPTLPPATFEQRKDFLLKNGAHFTINGQPLDAAVLDAELARLATTQPRGTKTASAGATRTTSAAQTAGTRAAATPTPGSAPAKLGRDASKSGAAGLPAASLSLNLRATAPAAAPGGTDPLAGVQCEGRINWNLLSYKFAMWLIKDKAEAKKLMQELLECQRQLAHTSLQVGLRFLESQHESMVDKAWEQTFESIKHGVSSLQEVPLKRAFGSGSLKDTEAAFNALRDYLEPRLGNLPTAQDPQFKKLLEAAQNKGGSAAVTALYTDLLSRPALSEATRKELTLRREVSLGELKKDLSSISANIDVLRKLEGARAGLAQRAEGLRQELYTDELTGRAGISDERLRALAERGAASLRELTQLRHDIDQSGDDRGRLAELQRQLPGKELEAELGQRLGEVVTRLQGARTLAAAATDENREALAARVRQDEAAVREAAVHHLRARIDSQGEPTGPAAEQARQELYRGYEPKARETLAGRERNLDILRMGVGITDKLLLEHDRPGAPKSDESQELAAYRKAADELGGVTDARDWEKLPAGKRAQKLDEALRLGNIAQNARTQLHAPSMLVKAAGHAATAAKTFERALDVSGFSQDMQKQMSDVAGRAMQAAAETQSAMQQMMANASRMLARIVATMR